MPKLFVLLLSVISLSALGQVDSVAFEYQYDEDLLPSKFHSERREALRALMPANSVAIVFSAPVHTRSNDVLYEYHQHPNMYYLSGYREPHGMLLVFKDSVDLDSVKTNEVLFVQPRNAKNEMWDGRRLGVAGARSVLGFNNVYRDDAFSFMRLDLSQFDHVLYEFPKDDVRDNDRNRGDLFSLVKHVKKNAGERIVKDGEMTLIELMARLRQQKTTEEIELMQRAIDFTCEAQLELMRTLKQSTFEYHSEAVVEYVFKKNGAEYTGFPSILGGGENSCILHYVSNRKPIGHGELIVSDIGAEYHGYTADVARTLPVSGTFTKEQRQIYEIVLAAQKAAILKCRAGNKFWEPGDVAKQIVQSGLKRLGIITKGEDFIKYFMHGTSHYLGLDVHDVGLYGQLKPGQVITVEPGIYIAEGADCDPKWWNIGIRIEDDVLITTGKPEVMSDCVPKSIVEIEAVMKEESILFKKR